jgi:hypothetical protein
MAGDLYTSKAKANKAASARKNIFRREFKKAVKNKEPDARRFTEAIKTVKVRKLKGLPKLYEVAGQ